MLEHLPAKVLEGVLEAVDSIRDRFRLEAVSRRLAHAARNLAWAGEGTLELRPSYTSLAELRLLRLALLPFPSAAEAVPSDGMRREIRVTEATEALEALLSRCSPWLRDLRLIGSNQAFLFPVPDWAEEALQCLLDYQPPLERLYLAHVFALAPSAPRLIAAAAPGLSALHLSLPADFYGEERSDELSQALADALAAAKACEHLEELVFELSANQRLSDAQLREVLVGKRRLKRLQLLRIRGLSGAGLRESLSAIGGPGLELLRVSECEGLEIAALVSGPGRPLVSLRRLRLCPTESEGDFVWTLEGLAKECPSLERLDFALPLASANAAALSGLVAGFLDRHSAGSARRSLEIQAHANLIISAQRLRRAVSEKIPCESNTSSDPVPFCDAHEHVLDFTAGAASARFKFCLDRQI